MSQFADRYVTGLFWASQAEVTDGACEGCGEGIGVVTNGVAVGSGFEDGSGGEAPVMEGDCEGVDVGVSMDTVGF